MPPISIQTSSSGNSSSIRRLGTEDKKSDLIVPTKYSNTLPDIPFDPKSLKYPFEANRFVDYKPTSLESSYKYEILSEMHLGVSIDLIDPDAYACNEKAELHPADAELVEDEVAQHGESKRLKIHSQNVSWLRRTEYISTEATRFQPPNADKVEAKVGHSIKKNFKETTLFMSVEDQIKAIEKTFEDAKIPIEKHHSKPHVHPVEVLPVFPDFNTWKYPCAQVIFDSDPAPVGRPIPAQLEEMSQAMIRGVMDATGEQFVAYFLPTTETMSKRRADVEAGRPYADDTEYEYAMAREYNWNVKSKSSKGYEENYFLIARQDGIFYNELETRVRLSKRRVKAGIADITKLVVKHRPLNEMEFAVHRQRERQLESTKEEDDQDSTSSSSDDDQRDDDHDRKPQLEDGEKVRSPRDDKDDRSEDGSNSENGNSSDDEECKLSDDEKRRSSGDEKRELLDNEKRKSSNERDSSNLLDEEKRKPLDDAKGELLDRKSNLSDDEKRKLTSDEKRHLPAYDERKLPEEPDSSSSTESDSSDDDSVSDGSASSDDESAINANQDENTV